MSTLKRRSLILAFILVFVFSMLPASLIAMDLEQEEIEEITIIESSSYDDYVYTQISSGAWVRIDYTIISDAYGDHVDPYSIELIPYYPSYATVWITAIDIYYYYYSQTTGKFCVYLRAQTNATTGWGYYYIWVNI